MRLNNLQLGVLRAIRNKGASGAYRLGATMNTLNALALKKMVKADRSNPGCFFSPRTSIIWHITDEGLKQVAHAAYRLLTEEGKWTCTQTH